MDNTGEINIYNPAKEIARESTLQTIINHRDAMGQAREGIVAGKEDPGIAQRQYNKIKGLKKMIAAQLNMITISRPSVLNDCVNKWERKSKPDDEKKFEDDDNNYNTLIMLKEVLNEANKDIIAAEYSASKDDDYLIEKESREGIKFILTKKYFEMINGLEDTFEKVYLIMLKHKIVSSGVDQDEVKTYKEQEEEAIRRVVEA